MVNTIVSIPGYVHLYRSLLRFYDMPENEIREMLYLLNTANLDCYEYYHPERELALSGPVAFCHWLETMDCRPYRTEVQLYKSLLFLQRSVDRDLIVTSQREALQTLKCIISNIEYRFYKAYEMEIEDKRTVYGECTYRLVPREDEPSVCLMHDWIYLPSAQTVTDSIQDSGQNHFQRRDALSRRKRSMPFLTVRWLYAGKSCKRKQRNTQGAIRTGWGLSRLPLLYSTRHRSVPLPGCWQSILFPCMTCALPTA